MLSLSWLLGELLILVLGLGCVIRPVYQRYECSSDWLGRRQIISEMSMCVGSLLTSQQTNCVVDMHSISIFNFCLLSSVLEICCWCAMCVNHDVGMSCIQRRAINCKGRLPVGVAWYWLRLASIAASSAIGQLHSKLISADADQGSHF